MSALVGFAIGFSCGFVLGVLAIVLVTYREHKWRESGKRFDA